MQTSRLPLAIITLVIGLFPAKFALADECTTSFYCYGSSAASTASTPTRPPPLPPPGQNYLQQRNQAQLTARTPPQYSPILPRLFLPIAQPVSRMAQPAPPTASPVFRSNMPPFPPAAAPSGSNGGVTCQAAHQNLLDRAAALESRAINASKTGQRQQASDMFRDVGKMRADAQRMPCK